MKFAVVGAGAIGKLRAETIAENRKTELVGVADVNRGAAEAAAGPLGAKAVEDYRQLLDEELDAVVISSPTHLHEEQCMAAFEAGCHVLIEKPLAPLPDACARIEQAAADAGKVLAVGFNHRYYPAIKYLKKCVDEGRIGKLDHLRVFAGHDGLANFRADWMYKGEICGGGAMMDGGIHTTDLARFVAGEVKSVYGVATNDIWKVEKSEDNAMAVFRTETGPPIMYQATWTEWRGYQFSVEAYGDKGMVRGSYAPMHNVLVTQEKPGAPRNTKQKRYPEIILREKLKGWTSTSKKTFEEELRDFLKRLDGEDTPLATGWDGTRAVQIAQAVYRSQREGDAVELPGRV